MEALQLESEKGFRAILTRPFQFGEPHALVIYNKSVHPLNGLVSLETVDGSDIRLKIGPSIELRQHRTRDSRLVPFSLQDEEEFWRAACDPATGLVYICTKCQILQLDLKDNANTMTLLAGAEGDEDMIDGVGRDARVDRPFCMLADGHGSLLIKDCGSNRIRRVVLPPAGSPSGTPSPLVITLPPEYNANIWAVAMDYANSQRLYVATKTAVYRHDALPYSATPPSAAECTDLAVAVAAEDGVPADGSADPALAPALLAGREGDNARTDGVVSNACLQLGTEHFGTSGLAAAALRLGPASGSAPAGGGNGNGDGGGGDSTARFGHITYMVVDGAGRLIIVEREPNDVEPCLRIVSPCGLVTSFCTDYVVSGSEFVMSVLPGGWLALHAWDANKAQLLRLGPGLTPSLPPVATAGGGGAAAGGLPGLPGLNGLAADLAALLDDDGVAAAAAGAGGSAAAPILTEPAAAADVKVVVGGRSFGCHRAILAARCEYFRRLFQSNFADSACSQVSLPDADPEAFSLLLRYLYCASMDFPPALLRPLAELADRLLLPAASATAQRQLLAACCPSSVVDDLLWAEARSFGELLDGLKNYYLANAHRVLEEAPDSLETLMNRSPRLHLDLYAAGIKRRRL